MKVNLTDIPEPGGRYEFGDLCGYGVYGKVYTAIDIQASRKKVAIKCQKYETGCKEFIEEEYNILKDLSSHLNIIDFYGIFKKNNEIWFVIEVSYTLFSHLFFRYSSMRANMSITL